jgi:hypothetical protein
MQTSTVKGLIAALFFSLLLTAGTTAQSNVFTYQGNVNNAGSPANGSYDFEFALFDAPSAGAQVGPAVSRSSVAVSNGIFSVQLDFGAAFTGPGRYLEIRVRQTGQPGFTTLSPRQFIASAPYSIKSLNTENLGGTPASQFVLTNDPRMSDARVPLAGSGDYVQNRFSQQSGTNFNISGNGTVGGTFTANTVSATSQFNIGTGRVLGVAGFDNTFVGLLAGTSNTGNGNSFFGSNAGTVTTTGSNSFFGAGAGRVNTSGFQNAFFGYASGTENSTGDNNTFYGAHSGHFNTIASDNSFFGSAAGYNNTGDRNAFFGSDAGYANTTGDYNSFFGTLAGNSNTTGIDNSFFGRSAGESSTTGSHNVFFGRNAGLNSTTGFNNAFVGKNAGIDNTIGGNDTFVGNYAGENNTTGNSNSFFGSFAGNTNTVGSNNTVIGAGADVGSSNLTFATAIGGGAIVSSSSTVVIGRESDVVNIPGIVRLFSFAAGSNNALCANFGGQVGLCGSSLRYKKSVETYVGGLDVVRKLRPISFRWKDGDTADLGFGAEEVGAIEPRLVVRNKDGVIEGVRYGQITTVLVNAVKEQQEEIERQAKVIEYQQQQIDLLMKIVCTSNKQSDACKGERK